MDKIVVGKRVRYLRKVNHLTREMLADRIEVTPKFLYEIEIGKKGFSAEILAKMATVLSVSSDYILFGTQDSKHLDPLYSVLEQFNKEQINVLTNIIRMIHELYRAS
ncbi:MAG: helix-turn-helix domain-containing protein [Lachnospiraceae bacterium]